MSSKEFEELYNFLIDFGPGEWWLPKNGDLSVPFEVAQAEIEGHNKASKAWKEHIKRTFETWRKNMEKNTTVLYG